MRFGPGIELAQWGPDPRSHTVRIWLAHYTPAKAVRIKRDFPPGWVSVVPWHGPLLSTLTNRYTDRAPYVNGDRIFMEKRGSTQVLGECSDAFAITTQSGRYGLTNGHCGGVAVWTNLQGHTVTQYMGPVTYRAYANHGYDLEEFKCDCAAPVWYGNNKYHAVVNWTEVPAGAGPDHEVTFDGATTGEVGGATVTENDICVDLRDRETGKTHGNVPP